MRTDCWILTALSAATLVRAQIPISTNPVPIPAALASLERNGKREANVHDPSTIVKCKDQYWLFATGVGVNSWRSKDLVQWERGPRVFATPPAWITNVVSGQRGYFWAPDIIHHQGRYWLYYSVSKFGVNTSAIALASNPTLDPDDSKYLWTDQSRRHRRAVSGSRSARSGAGSN